MIPAWLAAIISSSFSHNALTCCWFSATSLLAYSTMLIPSISLPGTSVSKSLTVFQTMSCFARFNTFESIVSTDNACASTIIGALRSAESKLSYLILTNVRDFGMGVMFSLASAINASEPSAPHNNRPISNWVSASSYTFFKS